MNKHARSVLLATVFTTVGSVAQAAPIGLDGIISAGEYGPATAVVTYDAAAPIGNFGSPGTTNHNVGYSVYVRSDAEYFYGAVQANGNTNGLDFANIYLNVDNLLSPGSDLGFEVTNDRFFIPGGAGYQNDTSNLLYSSIGTGTIEFAVAWSLLLNDPYGMGFNKAVPGGKTLISLSQSFGYSVAGGTAYGDLRLGAADVPVAAAVPEPASMLLLGTGLAGAGLRRWRKRQA